MSEVQPAAGVVEGGAPPAGDAAAAAAAAAAATPQPWMGDLPPELRADATLSRFADVPALASSYVELRRSMGNRLAVPAADAPAEAWDPVFKALGRPDGIDGYEVPIAEGVDPETTKPFRELAHKIGLNPAQAKQLAEFHNQLLTDAHDSYYAEGETSLQAVKAEFGDAYPQAEADARAAFAKVFGEDAATADALDQLVGSGPLVKGFANLAKLIGEVGRVDGGGDGGLGAVDANAEAELKALQKDPTWREKLNNGDATVVAQRQRLLAAAQRHALSVN